MTRRRWTRRDVLKAGGAALAFPYVIDSRALGQGDQPGANERVNIGIIGLGGRARYMAGTCSRIPEIQVAAVCDCFAPAIGTAHGVYKGVPKIAYDVLEKVATDTQVPIALHGGTGLSDEVFRKCIALGCAKVNISTQIKYAFIDGFVGYHSAHETQYDSLKVIRAQFDEMKKGIVENIKLFGGAGKA